jgi:hypothetical protein
MSKLILGNGHCADLTNRGTVVTVPSKTGVYWMKPEVFQNP